MPAYPVFAFYGTLRRGMSNYRVFQNALRYVQTVRLSGFRLYAADGYPYAVATGNAPDEIVVDLVEVRDETTQHDIHQLETEAGYFLDYVSISQGKFGIYLYQQNLMHDPLIEDGDWIAFCNRMNF